MYIDGLRVKMTREPNRVEIKVTELFTHHRMVQCFSCVSDQPVAEGNKTRQVVFLWTAVSLYAKYGIKSWVAGDAKSSYDWKMQVHTGKLTSGGPEKNQGMEVCLMGQRDGGVTMWHVTISSPLMNSDSSSWRGRSPWLAQFERTSLSSNLHCLHQRRGLLIKVCLHAHHHSSFLPPKEKQECSSSEHTAHRRWH